MYLVPLSGLPSIAEAPATKNGTGERGSSGGFADIMRDAMDTLRESQKAAEHDAYSLALGDVSDLHSLRINSAMEATAVETVAQLTSRAVSAYKEIMQMQI